MDTWGVEYNQVKRARTAVRLIQLLEQFKQVGFSSSGSNPKNEKTKIDTKKRGKKNLT